MFFKLPTFKFRKHKSIDKSIKKIDTNIKKINSKINKLLDDNKKSINEQRGLIIHANQKIITLESERELLQIQIIKK